MDCVRDPPRGCARAASPLVATRPALSCQPRAYFILLIAMTQESLCYAAAAVYLASDAAAMVTGSTMMIDGGWTAGK